VNNRTAEITTCGWKSIVACCTAIPDNAVRATFSAIARLLVVLLFVVKPDIADTEDDVIVVEGRHVTLKCHIKTGSPTPSVTWYINGSLAADVSRSPIIDPVARTLTVPSTTRADSGRYTCVGVNAAGSDVTHFDVHVIGL